MPRANVVLVDNCVEQKNGSEALWLRSGIDLQENAMRPQEPQLSTGTTAHDVFAVVSEVRLLRLTTVRSLRFLLRGPNT